MRKNVSLCVRDDNLGSFKHTVLRMTAGISPCQPNYNSYNSLVSEITSNWLGQSGIEFLDLIF